MKPCRGPLVVFLALATATATTTAGEPPSRFVGWLRDGTACFPDARPPTTFDGRSGINIRWKTPLPNWSNAGIIVVDGKVFTLVEPWAGFAPWLLCIDAANGTEIWRRELDPTATMPAAEGAAARTNALAAWEHRRRAELAAGRAHAFWSAHRPRFGKGNTPGPEVAEAWRGHLEALATLGYEPSSRNFFKTASAHGSGGAFTAIRGHKEAKAQGERERRMRADGLAWAGWRESGTWCGVAYPAPTSDGRRVVTVTAQGHVACHDLDGKLLWQRRVLTPAVEALTPAQRSRLPAKVLETWRGGTLGVAEYMTAPILVDPDGTGTRTWVVLNCARMVRCLDLADGTELWSVPLAAGFWHVMAVPRLLRIDGEAVLVAVAGSVADQKDGALHGDELLRLRDGASLGRLPGTGCGKHWGSGPIPLADDVILVGQPLVIGRAGSFYRKPKQAAALRLRWNRDRTDLEHEVLWQVDYSGDFFMGPARCGNLLYATDAVLDLETRQAKRAPWAAVHQGYCDHGCIVAGPYLVKWNRYGLRDRRDREFRLDAEATFHVFDRASGKELGVGRLPINPADGLGEDLKMIGEHDRSGWRWLGAAAPWAEGDRLYIRSYDFLWCIGTGR